MALQKKKKIEAVLKGLEEELGKRMDTPEHWPRLLNQIRTLQWVLGKAKDLDSPELSRRMPAKE